MSQPELLYACPYCERSGFTHRGLVNHFCSSAPLVRSGTAPKRFLTKAEITKIIVDSSLTPSTPTTTTHDHQAPSQSHQG